MIQALPSFERLSRREGLLSIGVLDRLPAAREVLARAPFVHEVFGVKDPWRDFEPRDTWAGFERGVADLCSEHPGALFVRTAPPQEENDPRACKAFRVAREIDVAWEPERPTLYLDGYTRGVAFAENVRCGKALVAIHGTSGNPAKDVYPEALARIALSRVGDERHFRCVVLPVQRDGGGFHDVAFHAGLLSECDLFVGVDSGPAHLASVVCPTVTWVFTRTAIQQAVPLWRDVDVVAAGTDADALIASWESWRRANRSMVRYKVSVTKGAHDAQTRLSAR